MKIYSFSRLFFLMLFAVVLINGQLLGTHYQRLHYNYAQQTLDKQKLEEYKESLSHYYNDGKYDNDVETICFQAKQFFSTVTPDANSAIIFDVDDTVLYHFQYIDRLEFVWSNNQKLIESRQNSMDIAIKPVLELYTYLINKGFKIIFLTARDEQIFNRTKNELVDAGYRNYEHLILIPHDISNNHVGVGNWKLGIRKQLEKDYTIVATFGDRELDFTGGHTGFEVRLPNYLY